MDETLGIDRLPARRVDRSQDEFDLPGRGASMLERGPELAAQHLDVVGNRVRNLDLDARDAAIRLLADTVLLHSARCGAVHAWEYIVIRLRIQLFRM